MIIIGKFKKGMFSLLQETLESLLKALMKDLGSNLHNDFLIEALQLTKTIKEAEGVLFRN